MAEFIRPNGESIASKKPDNDQTVMVQPTLYGSLFVGILHNAEADHDDMRMMTRVKITIEMTDAELAEMGGLGWLQPGRLIRITQ